jgi:hypothetical protein
MATRKPLKPAPAPVPAAPAPAPDAWVRWVALSTTLFAVCAAIASIKSGGYGGRIQIMTTQEANRWSQYQSKSIKQSLRQSQLDSFELSKLQNPTPKAARYIAEKEKFYAAEVERYDGEKKAIMQEAEDLQQKQADAKKHSGMLGQSVMFLQIAITLSSIAALMKQKSLWFAGMAVGAMGLGYMVLGLIL